MYNEYQAASLSLVAAKLRRYLISSAGPMYLNLPKQNLFNPVGIGPTAYVMVMTLLGCMA